MWPTKPTCFLSGPGQKVADPWIRLGLGFLEPLAFHRLGTVLSLDTAEHITRCCPLTVQASA